MLYAAAMEANMRQVGIAVFLAVALVGCAMEAPPEEGALPQGLTVLDWSEASLSVAYRRGDQVIYAEALRGEPTPEPYQSDPRSPRFQMDARFLSGEGYGFYTQRGNDGWIDDTWGEDRERQSALPQTTDSNEWMFELATELAAALPEQLEAELGAETAAALQPEADVLVGFGRTALDVYTEEAEYVRAMHEAEPQVPVIEGGPDGEVVYGDLGGPDDAWRSFPANYYYIAHYIGDIDYAWLCGGYHSASRIYEWRGGAWASLHDNDNHGRAPSDSSMWRNGLLQYYESVQDYHPAWTVQTCGTGYDALSNNGGHNCHDDIRTQMNNFVFSSAIGGSMYWCNDGDNDTDYSCGTEAGHPSTNARSRSGYNHPNRCAYNINSTCPGSYQGTGDGCDCGCVFPDGTGADPDCRY